LPSAKEDNQRVNPRGGPTASRALTICGALLLALSAASLSAQSATVMGVVINEDGEPLAAAFVQVEQTGRAVERAVTDSAGRFRIAGLAAGAYQLHTRALGYRADRRSLRLTSGQLLWVEIGMRPTPFELAELNIEADRARQRFEEQAGSTVRELDARMLRLIPGLAEADVMRAVEVLPGVISTSDFSASFNVRGGGADQNLILLDGFPIYNPFHLAGLFGVFNADMVARAALLAGGFPPRYGGRVASVLSVESDPGQGAFDLAGGVSVLATRVAAGVALPEPALSAVGLSRGRVRVAARRSYFDRLLAPFFEFPYHLLDLQLYGEAWTEGGARFHLTGYTGEDVLDLTRADPARFPLRLRWDWGNDVAGVGASVPVGGGRVLQARLSHTRFGTALAFPDFSDARFASGIEESIAALELTLPLGAWRAGGGIDARRLSYANIVETGGTVFRASGDRATHGAAHVQLSTSRGPWLVEGGMRLDGWWPDGAQGSVHAAPRVALKRFVAEGDAAWKLALGRYTQFAHSIRDEELPFGVDLWVLAGERAPVVRSHQVQVGYERFLGSRWRLEAESYLRSFDGVIANNFADDPNDPLDDLIAGTGLSHGGDVLIERRSGSGLNGWLTVSLLRATRTFPDVVSGEEPAPLVTYSPIFDRRVDVELVLRAPLPGGAHAGARWNFGSGLPYTRPLGTFAFHEYQPASGRYGRSVIGEEPQYAVLLGERNAARYPPYHRLDAGVRREFRPGRWRVEPYLEVLNVYNRRNVLFYFYHYDRDPPVRSGVSMFPVLPTLGVEVRF
jgi:hypothetical protein